MATCVGFMAACIGFRVVRERGTPFLRVGYAVRHILQGLRSTGFSHDEVKQAVVSFIVLFTA